MVFSSRTAGVSLPLLFTLSMAGAAGLAASQPVMYVRLLGTAGPSLGYGQAEAGMLVVAGPEVLLFDCGHGVPDRLFQLNRISVSKVFLSHLHSDHTEGLAELWMNWDAWYSRGTTPLSVWGPGRDVDQPAGTADLTSHLASAWATDTHIRRDVVEHLPGSAIQMQTTEIQSEGVVYQSNGVTVSAFLVDHGPVKPAFGYRIDYQGHSVVFSGDTRPSDNLVQHAKGADLLVHEVIVTDPTGNSSGNPIAAYHTSPEQAAGIFTQVAPRLAAYTHIVGSPQGLVARTRAAGYNGPLEVGQDLTLFEIGDSITTLHCPPALAAVTNGSYQNKISAGGTVIAWGSGFTVGGNRLILTPAGGSGQSVVLSETDGQYFWDQSTGQINAALPPAVTPGQWYMQVQNDCVIPTGALLVTVN
jgi:ribonuclease Z